MTLQGLQDDDSVRRLGSEENKNAALNKGGIFSSKQCKTLVFHCPKGSGHPF